jgi:Uma2 family endonuclease
MSTTTYTTADELLALPMGMGKRYELVAGELRVMSPAGWRHGGVVGVLQTLLGTHIYKNGLGQVFGAETGFLLRRDPDTVRAPDFAFIAKAHLPATDPVEAYWPGAPDLAVEVLSPSDTAGEVAEKVEEWLACGCAAVWVVDPKLRTITIYLSMTDVRIVSGQEELVGDPVVPGFTCAVADVFQ